VQGYLLLLEPSVTVHARKQDVAVVSQAAAAAAKTYTGISGREIQYDVEGTLTDDGCAFLQPSKCVLESDCCRP
jgi:V-type H+-transporting ATPase subunit E